MGYDQRRKDDPMTRRLLFPITAREIAAARLLVTLDRIEDLKTPEWIQDVALSTWPAWAESPQPPVASS